MAEAAQTTTEPKETEVAKKLRQQEEQTLLDYLESLNAEVPIRVTVQRLRPKIFKGINIGGTLETFEDPISEEDIKEHFGGGKYKLTIQAGTGDGNKTVFRKNRTIDIAGPPKIDMYNVEDPREAAAPTHGSPDVVMAAMSTASQMAERAERARQRAEELARDTRGDPATKMVMDEMRALRAESAAKDERMFQVIREQNNGSSAIEQLLGKMMDGESSRVTMLRQQVDSELRMKADMHRAEIDRLHARFEDAVKRQEDQHRREVDNLTRAHDNVLQTTRMAYESQIEGYKRELQFVGNQLTAVQAELAELRGRKDKSSLDHLSELAAMKEAMEAFTGGDKSESTIERVLGGIMSSPLAEGVATRLAGAAPAGSVPQAVEDPATAVIPIDTPVVMPDGKIMVKRPNGQLVQLKKKPPPDPNAPVSVPDSEILAVVPYMENALAADRGPQTFANTARNLMPTLISGPIGQMISKGGVDALLDRVAQLRPESPLLSQHGKNWVREVTRLLSS